MKQLFMRLCVAGAALVVALAASTVLAQDERYPRMPVVPIDQSARDAALQATLVRLREVAAKRDSVGLAALIAPSKRGELLDVMSSNGPPDPWEDLRHTLSHGGGFTKERGAQFGREEYCTPFAYVQYPLAPDLSDELLNLTEGNVTIVTERNVPVRRRPASKAAVVGRLSLEIVAGENVVRPNEDGAGQFDGVRLPNGKSGFVDTRSLWEPHRDYHVCLAKNADTWQIVAFQTGFR